MTSNEKRLTNERDLLGEALGKILIAGGVVTPGVPLTGPMLLMTANDYLECVVHEQNSYKIPLLSSEYVQAFRDAGFAEKTYDHSEGVFLSKRSKYGDMGTLLPLVFEGEALDADQMCTVELTPEGDIQIAFDNILHHERYSLLGEFGSWKWLADDAGVNFNDTE